ncbi:ATP-binding protein [Dactylosporangium sp. NPDC000521]|uniref:ATP-binding protein n=1 Tax=Dactylosporangium sp. NPDC000521 TaxID=3363975 RepID=UPI0036751000
MSTLTAHFDLPISVGAPALARQAMVTTFAGWGFTDTDWIDRAMLAVTELVTNAVRYGGGRVVLALEADEGHVTISVADGSAVVPRLPTNADTIDRDSGRGIAIIAALAERWGVEDHEGGKRVWVLMPPHPSP